MNTASASLEPSWAPPSCTLPTTDQPLRVQQFDQLFADAVTAVERIDSSTARFTLRPEPHLAARAAELSSRETSCCSFFTFTLTFTQGHRRSPHHRARNERRDTGCLDRPGPGDQLPRRRSMDRRRSHQLPVPALNPAQTLRQPRRRRNRLLSG